MLTLKRRNRRTTASSRWRASRTIPFLLVALLAGSLLTAPPAAPAEAATPAASAATAKWLNLPLLTNLPVAGLAHTATEYSAAGPNTPDVDPLNLSLLSTNPNIALGNITLPLFKTDEQSNGLLEFGSLGALSSYSSSPSPNTAHAATGLIDSNGALKLADYNEPGLTDSTLDLSALIRQLPGLADNTMLTTAGLEIGAVGSEARAGNLSSDITTGCTFPVEDDYVLTDLRLKTESPLIGDLVTDVNELVNSGIITPLQNLVTAITTTVNGLGTLLNVLRPVASLELESVTINIDKLEAAVDEVLTTPLESSDGIRIDLTTGAIEIDLGKLAIQDHLADPPRPQWIELSDLPANTPALDADTITSIVNGVTDLLNGDPATHPNSLTAKLLRVLNQHILGVEIKITLKAEVLCLLNCDQRPLTISGTLAQFAGIGEPPTLTGSALTIAGINVGGLVTPLISSLLVPAVGAILNPLLDPTTGLVATLQPLLVSTVNSVVLTPLIGTTATPGVLRTLLENLVEITINRQPTVPTDPTDPTTATDGDLGPGSFTVRSLEVVVLPKVTTDGAVAIQLGSSTVMATTPVCLALQKNLSEESPYPWALGAEISDWQLQATGTAAAPGFTVTAAEVSDPVTVLPGTYTLSESATVISSGLPPTAYRGEWQCIDTDGAPFTPPLGASGEPGTATITIAGSAASSVTVEKPPVVTCTVTNTLISATAAWQKTDGGSPPLPLSGAEWTLARVTAPAQTSIPVTEPVGDGSSFEAASLPVGTYTLTETRAPIGFLAGPATTFVVQPDGSTTGLPENISNLPLAIPEIPLTGGWGTMHNMITGLLLLTAAISAAIFAYSRTRKRST